MSPAVLVFLVTASFAPSAVGRAAAGIVVGGALIGLPHAAVDHVVRGWLAGRPLPLRWLAALLAGYALLDEARRRTFGRAPGAD